MFKPQFAPLVVSGAKRQTIRPVPKGRRPQPGDLESWRAWSGRPYWSETRELAQVKLVAVDKITIREGPSGGLRITVPGTVWPYDSLDSFAKADGFSGMTAMRRWFVDHHGLPFKGILIRAETV